MKILSGEFKGRNFFMPAGIRPTQNMTRKAVIDLLGQDLTGLHFLDLFAGSGGMGLEAFSCGAQSVTMVERDSRNYDIIRRNMEMFGLDQPREDGRKCEVLQNDVFSAIKLFAGQKRRFDVVFVDPPYDVGKARKALKTLGAYDILQPLSYIIIEHGKREGLPYCEHDFDVLTERKYGKSYLKMYQRRKADDAFQHTEQADG
ncbi:MAG: 16S rRNA (guanine(966)-N(2))-methyltransferase RsmD [Candidatus Omnitrophota bacterium]